MNINYKNKYLKYKKKYLDLKKMNNKSGGSFFRNTYKNYMAKKRNKPPPPPQISQQQIALEEHAREEAERLAREEAEKERYRLMREKIAKDRAEKAQQALPAPPQDPLLDDLNNYLPGEESLAKAIHYYIINTRDSSKSLMIHGRQFEKKTKKNINSIPSKLFEENEFGLHEIEELTIDSTNISEIPKTINYLKNLREITIKSNNNLTDIHPEILNSMRPKLYSIIVENNPRLPDTQKPQNFGDDKFYDKWRNNNTEIN